MSINLKPTTDLEEQAFAQNNITARSKLYSQLGPAEYAEREQAWGATKFRAGKRPDGTETKPNGKATSTNPFTTLRGKDGKIDPVQMAKVVSMLRAMGTKAVAAIARSVDKRLDGTDIPQRYL